MPDRQRWAGLVVIGLAVSLVVVDITIVNVTIPAIVADLGISAGEVQWVHEAYTLLFAALLLVFGRLGDCVGRRRMLLIGVVVFAVASAVATQADSGGPLITARVLQGVGGAAIFPVTLSLINATFIGRERGTAFAVWGSTIAAMAALGPLLGGWLTTAFSWRWAFGINVPLAAIVVVGTLLLIGESRDRESGRGADVVGATLAAVSTALLVFALIEGRELGWLAALHPEIFGLPWRVPISPVLLALTGSVGGALLFLALERHRAATGRVVLLDLSLFAIPTFRWGTATALVVALGEFGILFALPLWLQNAMGYSALQTGVVLLPFAVASLIAGGAGGSIAAARGGGTAVRLGLVFEVIGMAGIGLVIAEGTPWWLLVPTLAVYGFGVGLSSAQLGNVALADVPARASGQASGIQTTSQQIGSALGIAVLGTVLFTTLGSGFDDRLDDAGMATGDRVALVTAVEESAGGVVPALAENPATAAVADDAREAVAASTRTAAFTAAGFLVFGLLTSLRLESEPGVGPHPTTRRTRPIPRNGPNRNRPSRRSRLRQTEPDQLRAG